MYKSFRIINFRCFKELEVNSLKRVNLIAGMNNIGKTAFLEALFLHGGTYNPNLVLAINAFRGIEKFKIEFKLEEEPPWNNIFNEFDTSKEIELESVNIKFGKRSIKLKMLSKLSELKTLSDDLGTTTSILNDIQMTSVSLPDKTTDNSKGIMTSSHFNQILKLVYKEKKELHNYYLIAAPSGIRIHPHPPAPPFQTYFLGSRMITPLIQQAELFGKLQIKLKKDALVRILNIIEPKLSYIETVAIAGNIILHGEIGMGRLVPFPIMGEGIVRLTNIVLRIANAPKGVVLIDEIENGFHYSVMKKIWKAISEIAREFDTQIFATTHNFDCIKSAHQAFSESEDYDFRLHRIDRVENKIIVKTYDQEALDAAIETGLEIR